MDEEAFINENVECFVISTNDLKVFQRAIMTRTRLLISSEVDELLYDLIYVHFYQYQGAQYNES